MTIKKLFTVGLILTAAISLNAAYRSYGNDYLNLLRGPGGELYGSAYGLMASGSENVMLDPDYVNYTLQGNVLLGRYYLEKGEKEKTLQTIEDVLKNNPKDSFPCYIRNKASSSNGR